MTKFYYIILIFIIPVFLQAQTPYIGEIRLMAGTVVPAGWAKCDGQLLSIAQNTALFSLVGTIYGGDGETTFAVPDLRGRVPLHYGNGTGLSNRTRGERGGQESVTLAQSQIPSHSHTVTLPADSTLGSSDNPRGALPARNAAGTPVYGTSANAELDNSNIVVSNSGGGQSHNNMPPYTVITYMIALTGVFPTGN